MVILERSLDMGHRHAPAAVKFEWKLILPIEVQVGDLLMCYYHDDQHERRTARVVDTVVDRSPGFVSLSSTDGSTNRWSFNSQIYLTCRHVNAKHLDAPGGPAFVWRLYPWNQVARISPKESGLIVEEYELKDEQWVKL